LRIERLDQGELHKVELSDKEAQVLTSITNALQLAPVRFAMSLSSFVVRSSQLEITEETTYSSMLDQIRTKLKFPQDKEMKLIFDGTVISNILYNARNSNWKDIFYTVGILDDATIVVI